MPYWNPGTLEEEQTWRLTAFLLRANGLWDAREELNASNADRIQVGPPSPTPTPGPAVPPDDESYLPVISIPVVILLLVVLLYRMLRRKEG
jgi:hypothetical protein